MACRLRYTKSTGNLDKESVMMKKLTLTLVTVSLAFVFAAAVFAFGFGGGRGHGGGDFSRDGCDFAYIKAVPGINLTDAQATKLNAISQAGMKDAKPILDKMFIKRGDLKLLWLENNPNQKKIVETRKEIRALRDQMEDKIDAYRFEALNVLTPEQRGKLNSYRQGCAFAHGMEGRGTGQGGPHHPGAGIGMDMRDSR
jgi:Spy/CpxP family protein refolding chaperone